MMQLLHKRICLDSDDVASEEALTLFRGVTVVLQKFPMLSILQMIHSDYQGLDFYLQILLFVVELMGAKVHVRLKGCQELDDAIRNMYVNSGFIEFVVLQLVDLFYSQILKQAWGEAPSVSSNLRQIISNLVYSLRKVTNVMETVCRVLCTKFHSQQWFRISNSSELASFLTSVNPAFLREFVCKGESTLPANEGKFIRRVFHHPICLFRSLRVRNMVSYLYSSTI